MSNEFWISNEGESIRFEKFSDGRLLVRIDDYENDEFMIFSLTAEQKIELRDWLNDGSSGKTFSARNGR